MSVFRRLFTALLRHWIRNVILTLVLLAAFFLAYQNRLLPGIKPTVTYKTINPVVKDIRETLSLSGSVAADEQAILRFQSSGLLTWVGVKEGDLVKKGQALASLDKRQLQKDLQKELNDFLNEHTDFDQTQDDYRSRRDALILTDAMKRILDKAQYDLNNSVIDVEIKDLALKLATITTPIAGVVTHIDTPNPGINITPAGAEFHVVNPDSLYFSGELDETDIASVSLGQSVEITLDAFPDQPLLSTVSRISFTPMSGVTGTVYEVKIFLSPDPRLKVGLNGDASIILKTKSQVLTVPESAISISANESSVQVLAGDKSQRRVVTTGIVDNDGNIEVLSGLSESDLVIISNGSKK
ncbi:hypothetical protein A2368_00660 [Candidatus Collierbacteria bacterium RIFOXYB1_FULL_49_13]|uniref:Uncharacterized protein n=1 Tax=Candidatus Collierbacteria bacterium RIFOXYB1_FULL_49_13 TaxID=1817728 RepID=A0A1F5FHH5_9BACT|nr:MAG: hypothetical protein A2368_00660 [Candidatus Collierbacteria bacterium RIFOXYB1_FULL_49_13]